MSAYVGLGDVTRAVPVARRLQESATSQVANLVMTVDATRREAWEGLVADIDAGLTVGPLFDVLVRGWALVGTGSMGAALETFDEVADNPGVEGVRSVPQGPGLGIRRRFRGGGRHPLWRGRRRDAAHAARGSSPMQRC